MIIWINMIRRISEYANYRRTWFTSLIELDMLGNLHYQLLFSQRNSGVIFIKKVSSRSLPQQLSSGLYALNLPYITAKFNIVRLTQAAE